MLTVAEIMTREPYTLGPDDTLADARKLMTEHHIRHIPVLSAEGALIGLVSQRDVLAAEDSSVLNPEGAEGSRDQYVAISAVMTAPAQTVEESAPLRATAMHIQRNKLGCLPVLAKGSLVGIITDSDFVSVAINLMEQMELAEADESELFDEGDESF